MSQVARLQPWLMMGGLGIVSGILSDLSLSLSPPFPFSYWNAPLYPGLIFGFAVGMGLHNWAGVSWWRALLALLISTAAWLVAFEACLVIYDWLATKLGGQQVPMPYGGETPLSPEAALRLKDSANAAQILLPVSVFFAGAIGAGGTALGAAMASPIIRDCTAWFSITLVGGFCGVVLYGLDKSIGTPAGYEFLTLFVVWQAVVSATIGSHLTTKTSTPKRSARTSQTEQ